MATTAMDAVETPVRSHKLAILRVALAGGVAAAMFFALCWLGAVIGFPNTHAYIPLFTTAERSSVAALAEGLCWSTTFGLLVGGLFAFFYNLFAALDRAAR